MSDDQVARRCGSNCKGGHRLVAHNLTNSVNPGVLTLHGVERWLIKTFVEDE